MGNVNVNKVGEAAMLDLDAGLSQRMAQQPLDIDPFPPSPKLNSQTVMALGIVGGAGWIGVLVVLGIWRAVVCWDYCYGAEATAINVLWWAWLYAPLVGGVVGGAVLMLGWMLEQRAKAARIALTRDRYANPVSAVQVLRQSEARAWDALTLASQVDVATAPYNTLRNADVVTLNNASPAHALPALPAPALDIGPLPVERWAALVDAQPHTLLASKTGGGKSTLARYILARRIAAGGRVMLIDPHWSPAAWWGLPGHGAGEDWQAIQAAFEVVHREYGMRLLAHAKGQTAFDRLTVLVDEAVITRAQFETRGRSNPWTAFATVLGSGARKVSVSVVLLTQSVNVQDLGLSGPLRENYARIALDSRTCKQLIDEDVSRDRRQALATALPAQGQYPAAMDVDGEIYYLDRRGIVDVAMPAGAESAVWWPTVAVQPSVPVRPHVNGAVEAVARAVEADRRQTDGIDKVALLRALRGAGKSRDEARAFLRDYNVEFDNGLWTQAGGEA